MEKPRKRRGRRAHLNDFHQNLTGEFVYTGALCACTTPPARQAVCRRRLWTLTALLLAAAVLGGCIPAPGMQNHFYVILPYLGELAFSVSVLWALVRLGRDWTAVREYVYERTVPTLPHRAAGAAAFALIGAAAECVHLVLSGSGGQTLSAAVYLLLKLVSTLCALFIRREIRLTNWDKVPKNPGC